MGHNITAVVGPVEVVAKIVEAAGCPAATDLPFGLAIAPLGHVQIDRLTRREPGEVADGFNALCPALEGGLLAATGGGDFAYIETEYFGGTGVQAAAVFSERSSPRRLVDTQPGGPINHALRCLGVVASNGQDEFDTLELHRFRKLGDLGLDELVDE